MQKTNKVRCEHCEAMRVPSNMAKHQNTYECKRRARLNALKSRTDTVRFDHNHELGKMALLGEIPSTIFAYDFNAFVPKWIWDAYQIYNNNKGYAGMPFAEFLQRMGPPTTTE